MGLCTADIFQSWAVITSYYWTANPIVVSNTCTFQGFFFNFGDLASSFWAATICVYSVLVGIFNRDFQYFEVFAHAFCWGAALIFSTVGFAVPQGTDPSFYGNSGAWCWIDPYYATHRIVFHYLYIWIILILLVVAYGYMAYKLKMIVKNSQAIEKENQKRLKKITKKLAGYPIAYFCIFAPLALDRTLRVSGVLPPYDYLIFAMCIFAMNGFSNAMIYCYTRSIFQRYKKLLAGETTFSETSGSAIRGDRASSTSINDDDDKDDIAKTPSRNITNDDDRERMRTESSNSITSDVVKGNIDVEV